MNSKYALRQNITKKQNKKQKKPPTGIDFIWYNPRPIDEGFNIFP